MTDQGSRPDGLDRQQSAEIAALRTDIAVLLSRIDENLLPRLTTVHDKVMGNGGAGLVERVRSLEQPKGEWLRTAREWAAFGGAIVALILSVLNLLGGLP